MAIVFFSGLETGDASELAFLSAGASIQSATVRTGAYALKQSDLASQMKNGLAATQSVFRGWVKFPAGNSNLLQEHTGAAFRCGFSLTAGLKINAFDSGATLGALTNVNGNLTLTANTWHLFEAALDLAANGAIKTWIDGIADINGSHATNVSGTPTDGWRLRGLANPNEFFWDDLAVATGQIARIGDGRCIARQGLAGAPTYDAWTKNGAATAALCWSNTPFSAATNCSDNVQNDVQTMLVEKFSIVQAGHGPEIIRREAKINACKVAMIAKSAVAGNCDIRRRVGGVNTDVTKALTVADAYYDTGIFTDTVYNIDAYQVGAKNDLVATLQTVEDMWMMVDYVPRGAGPKTQLRIRNMPGSGGLI